MANKASGLFVLISRMQLMRIGELDSSGVAKTILPDRMPGAKPVRTATATNGSKRRTSKFSVACAGMRRSGSAVDFLNKLVRQTYAVVRYGSISAGRDSRRFFGLATCYAEPTGRDRPGAVLYVSQPASCTRCQKNQKNILLMNATIIFKAAGQTTASLTKLHKRS